jgi:hypothetical protein
MINSRIYFKTNMKSKLGEISQVIEQYLQLDFGQILDISFDPAIPDHS